MIFTRWNSKTDWSESACSFSSIYLSPLSKNSHFWKNPGVNNKHLCTADTAKAWESNHIWKEAAQYPIHTAWQAHGYKPKQPLLFPLQYKLANADEPLSSSWLPSPWFELRTPAGYSGYRGMFLPRQEAYLPLNLSKTKRNLPYIRNQSVPHCKHFPPGL